MFLLQETGTDIDGHFCLQSANDSTWVLKATNLDFETQRIYQLDIVLSVRKRPMPMICGVIWFVDTYYSNTNNILKFRNQFTELHRK